MIALGASLEFRIVPKVQKPGMAAMMMAAYGNTAGPDCGYTDKEDENMAICGMCGKPNIDKTLKKCSRCKGTTAALHARRPSGRSTRTAAKPCGTRTQCIPASLFLKQMRVLPAVIR